MSTDSTFSKTCAALSKLIHQKLRAFSRAADTFCIGFGEDTIYVNLKGQSIVKPEYAIHIQCYWEITEDGKVILSQDDFNKARAGVTVQTFQSEQFGNSIYDEVAHNINANVKNNPVYVVTFEADITGGFQLMLSNNYVIKVYPDDPSEGESWRYFKINADDSHLVIFDDVI